MDKKELLLIDLCARLPYKVICRKDCKTVDNEDFYLDEYPNPIELFKYLSIDDIDITIKPYLRPMSSMTEEEKEELLNLLFDKDAKYFYIDEKGFIDSKTSDLMKEGLNYPAFCPINIVLYTNWLNAHHFDYRGLIELNLAIDCTNLHIYI